MTPRCWWCGAPAERLCDGVLANTPERLISLSSDHPLETCDAEVCNACSEQIRTTLQLPPKARRDTGEYCDTIDKCPFCVLIAGQPKLGPLLGGRRTMLTAEEHRSMARVHARSNFRPRLSIVRGPG